MECENITSKPNTAKNADEQSNIIEDSENVTFEDFLVQGLKSGGVHIVASKSHGKSRLMFQIFQTLQKQPDVRCIAYDGSETWLYSASKVPVFTIQELDIISQELKSTEDMEHYTLVNWNLVKLALETHKDILFRLKTRKPSKRGFFVRTIVNYLDALQRQEKADSANHENTKAISYFIEEAQDCFNNRSSGRLEMEEFLTVFNEARNNREAFYTASQRLTDFSKTIRSKQLPCFGKLASEDITPNLRRIEKAQKIDFSKMQPKTWFFEGSTFTSPDFKQSGKPFQVNKVIKADYIKNLKPEEKPKPKLSLRGFLDRVFGFRQLKPNEFFEKSGNSSTVKTEPMINADSENWQSESESEVDESEDWSEEW
jgi:hypothetical protein